MENLLMSISASVITKQVYAEIQKINDETLEYGLKLSDTDIKTIIETRNEVLNSIGRVELGGGIIAKIISVFCDSPYISQYNYVETIDELIETFYYYKNETMEEISDDELIDFMKEYFDNKCQGDLELLRYKYLDKAAHNVKWAVSDCLNVDEDLDNGEESDDNEGEEE